MPGSRLRVTLGATSYDFNLAGDVKVFEKPEHGEIQKQIATQRREDQLDAPLTIHDLKGIGIAIAHEGDNERVWEMKNIQNWHGRYSLGPLARTVTDKTGTHRMRGFHQSPFNWFYHDDLPSSASAVETVGYWGVAGTWTDCTCTADFNAAAGANSAFPCVGMASVYTAAAGYRTYALRLTRVQNGAAWYQLIYNTATNGVPTAWTAIDHTADASTPSAGANSAAGLVSIGSTLYTAVSINNALTLRRSTNDGVTWTATATASEPIKNPPTNILVAPYNGTLRPFVFAEEGVWVYDGTNLTQIIEHVNRFGVNAADAGRAATVWYVDGVAQGYIVYAVGREIRLVTFETVDNNPIVYNIAPWYRSQGLPTFRDGRVLALASVPNYLVAAIAGDSANTTGGLYYKTAEYFHPLGWYGPFYDVATANRQVRAMGISSFDDGTVRLHIGVDNGTANDTDPLYFDNITSDPTSVSNYLHAPTGTLIFPRHDLGLPDVLGPWRSAQVIGAGLSSTL